MDLRPVVSERMGSSSFRRFGSNDQHNISENGDSVSAATGLNCPNTPRPKGTVLKHVVATGENCRGGNRVPSTQPCSILFLLQIEIFYHVVISKILRSIGLHSVVIKDGGGQKSLANRGMKYRVVRHRSKLL